MALSRRRLEKPRRRGRFPGTRTPSPLFRRKQETAAVPKTPASSDAEKAMGANADSRAQQGAASDKALKRAEERDGAENPPAGADLLGPKGDPAEGKRAGPNSSSRQE